jgi:transcriptional regulator with XRE-family HTH domain
MTQLKQWLTEKGMKVDDLARALGRHRVTVFRYLRGEDMPRPDTATRIESVTEGAVTVSHLLTDHQAWRAAR